LANTAYTVTLATNSGFSGPVSFALACLPANTSAGFNPASLSGPGSSTLSVTTATNTPAGTYTLTIRGTNAAFATNTMVSLIVSSPPSRPKIAAVRLNGDKFVFRGMNGAPGLPCSVLASTNLLMPLTQWTIVSTNLFDANGNFSFTNTASPDAPQQFYLLELRSVIGRAHHFISEWRRR
jgi:hypothetical protein